MCACMCVCNFSTKTRSGLNEKKVTCLIMREGAIDPVVSDQAQHQQRLFDHLYTVDMQRCILPDVFASICSFAIF